MADDAQCAVKTYEGNWNVNQARVSEIAAYRRADEANSRGTPLFRLYGRPPGKNKSRGPILATCYKLRTAVMRAFAITGKLRRFQSTSRNMIRSQRIQGILFLRISETAISHIGDDKSFESNLPVNVAIFGMHFSDLRSQQPVYNKKLEGPVADDAPCAVKTYEGNWNVNQAHVSEIATYRSADKAEDEERRYFGYMGGRTERASHGVRS